MAAGVNAQATKTCSPTSLAAEKPLPNDDGVEVVQPFDGTYRFIFTANVKQAFTNETIKLIETSRKADEEVTLVLSPYCKVQILSQQQISSEGFVPFTKSYVFEN